jgi:hypothetical protein
VDSAFAEVILRLRDAISELDGLGKRVGWDAALRGRVETELAAIDASLDELDRILDEAIRKLG